MEYFMFIHSRLRGFLSFSLCIIIKVRRLVKISFSIIEKRKGINGDLFSLQQKKIGHWLFFQKQHFLSIYLQYLTTPNLLEIDFIILKIVTRIESSFPLDFLKIRRNPKWRCVYFSKWFFKERTIRKELVGDVKTRTHASFSEVLQ